MNIDELIQKSKESKEFQELKKLEIPEKLVNDCLTKKNPIDCFKKLLESIKLESEKLNKEIESDKLKNKKQKLK